MTPNALRRPEFDRVPRRHLLFMGAVGFLLFVFYGSLVPLDLAYIPFDEAVRQFWESWALSGRRPSRVDIASNVILMLPVGFCLIGGLCPTRAPARAIITSLLVVLVCALASFCIEFAQIYTDGRTPSKTDIVAQVIGAGAGCGLWWLWGRRLWIRFFSASTSRPPLSLPERVLWVYLLLIFGYNVMPLDITVNPADLYQKWKIGKIELIPFSTSYETTIALVYGLVTDILIWVPAGLLWVLSAKKTAWGAWVWALGAVCLLEFLQLLIFTRFASTTDVIMGAAGAGAGAWIGRRMVPRLGADSHRPPTRSGSSAPIIGLIGAVAWTSVLCIIFWYPYEFVVERSMITQRLDELFRVPFSSYYSGSILSAITGVFQKVLFFIPLGGAFSAMLVRLRGRGFDGLLTWMALFAGICVATGIELVQILIPEKAPGATDIIIETAGCMAGYYFVTHWLGNHQGVEKTPTRFTY